MAETKPKTSSQIDLSVGAPVNKRDTSEPTDSEALKPKMVRMIPTTSSAIPTGLFIYGVFRMKF